MNLLFTPAGEARCLYTDQVDLRALGTLRIERASTIDFNLHTQEWEVRRQPGKPWASTTPPLFAHASREVCLRWEHDHDLLLLQP